VTGGILKLAPGTGSGHQPGPCCGTVFAPEMILNSIAGVRFSRGEAPVAQLTS